MPTIGVAIAIPEPWGEQLQAYRVDLGDVTALQIPTHVTLTPPTEVTDDRLPALERALGEAAARVAPFRMHLRGTGTFRPVSPVVFVAVAEGISHCEHLADAVRTGPLHVEREYPYHPHVTVAHHLEDALLDRAFDELRDVECTFLVDRFFLYVHDDSSGWRPAREFALTGREAG